MPARKIRIKQINIRLAPQEYAAIARERQPLEQLAATARRLMVLGLAQVASRSAPAGTPHGKPHENGQGDV